MHRSSAIIINQSLMSYVNPANYTKPRCIRRCGPELCDELRYIIPDLICESKDKHQTTFKLNKLDSIDQDQLVEYI